MKKKILKFLAIVVIAGLSLCNVYKIVGSDSNDMNLNTLATMSIANAEDGTWGDYYIEWWTPNDVWCWHGGYFCCPGWGDCII